MDYKKIYDQLMTSRLSVKSERKIQKKSGEYFERHHIIPLSLDGDKSYALGSDNIVLLTAREHYLAHRMLWLIYRTREMGFAFHRMVFSASPLQKRKFDSRAYEAAKKAASECQRGVNGTMYGKGSAMKGKPSVNKGKKLGTRPYQNGENNPSKRQEVRDKISQKLTGLKKNPMKDEYRNKISERTKGEANPNFGKFRSHFTDIEIFEYSANDGVFIKKWDNIVEASEFYGIDRRYVYNNIRGKSQSCNNSIWFSEYMGDEINAIDYLKIYKQVIEYNIDGRILNSWDSLNQASEKTGISTSQLSRIIKKDTPYKNRIFKYK
jgi:hypothetical protein